MKYLLRITNYKNMNRDSYSTYEVEDLPVLEIYNDYRE